jgi:hypothetical protein
LDALFEKTKDHWAVPPRELRLLFSTLSGPEANEPAKSWILSHQRFIKEVDPITASIAPEAAVFVVKEGGTVNLFAHNGSDWSLQAQAVARIASCDEEVAKVVFCHNSQRLAKAISRLGHCDDDSDPELPAYLDMVAELDAALIPYLFLQVQVSEARENWFKKLLQKGMKPKRVLASVIKHATSCDGPVCQLAIEIRDRLPSQLQRDNLVEEGK